MAGDGVPAYVGIAAGCRLRERVMQGVLDEGVASGSVPFAVAMSGGAAGTR